jgi:dienelactone hydrolase
MRDAVLTIATRARATSIVLVGYSGGGVLAVLVAERLDHVAGVITVAANLDVDAWVKQHGYLPLTQSLNPALSILAHPWPELHLQGERDTVVPAATTHAYFERYPAAQLRSFAEYDHVCCWVAAWPEVLAHVAFANR